MGVSVYNDPNPTTNIRRTFHFQDCFEILIVVSFCITLFIRYSVLFRYFD